MTRGAQSGNEDAALTLCQRERVSRLRPLLERLDPQAVPGGRIGASASPLAWICREKTTSRTSYRFLREEAAG